MTRFFSPPLFFAEDENLVITELMEHCSAPVLTLCSEKPWIIVGANAQAELQFRNACPPLEPWTKVEEESVEQQEREEEQEVRFHAA